MSSFTRPIALSAPFARSVAIAALLGTTMLVSPLSAARAGTVADRQFQLAQTTVSPQQAGTEATKTKGETVEQRIVDLHAALEITPVQEPMWNNVAQAMRENAANMEKLVASDRTTPPQNMTAVEDLKSYQQFAQAHVDGLKNLIDSFSALYDAMPGPQQKIADQVFNTAGRERAAAHS
jgi:periplasmic protein CpxP/Spy